MKKYDDIEIIREYTYNQDIFTQALDISPNGEFYISSGLYEKSFYQISDSIECINNPRIKRYLDRKYFAEGMTPSPYGYYLLTWKENTAFLFDNDTDELIKTFNYEGEGWGLITIQLQIFYI